jgi:hypothetical protein
MPASAAPPTTANTSTSTKVSGQYDTLDDIGILACLRVVAVDMRVFTSSTSNTVIGRKFFGDIVNATAKQNNRYRITSPLGWISADPRWTDPC